ncbi:DUF2878 domain-containing protein [Trinickia dabaoshanensis]|uniref:DUF2878 domain-containing protein n=1 Tax=Trinickia dabaoshanensis TaxID=564714 RepID=UPI001E34C83C|nr:DUF2878 domain-containing protein [Trinickia dabaoshanensis]
MRDSERGRSGPRAASRAARRAELWQYGVVGQVAWLCAVLGGAHGRALPGLLTAAGIVCWHLWRAPQPTREARVVAIVAIGGWLWDSALAAAGWLVYPGVAAAPAVAPAWIAALWAIFAVQLNVLFVWLRGRWVLAMLIGACAGPLSFRAGASLGAVRFAHPWQALAMLAAGWSLLLPLAVAIARRWDGVRPRA